MNAGLVSNVCLISIQVDAAPDEPILLQAMNENDSLWPNGSAHHGMEDVAVRHCDHITLFFRFHDSIVS